MPVICIVCKLWHSRHLEYVFTGITVLVSHLWPLSRASLEIVALAPADILRMIED